MSTFDKIYRSALPMKFFSRGWGKPETLIKLVENINIISNRENFLKFVSKKPEIIIEKHIEQKNIVLIEASFRSPFSTALPGIMETENETARFQLVIPKSWRSSLKPICFHFAGTGDHTYSRRRYFLANGLLNDGIGSIIIVNPYYWNRKPKDQKGSSLNYVSDLFVMGGALILECSTILNWCELNGYGPFALHGISMGGYMASLCATVWPKPISLIPCLSWTTASTVFVNGVLGTSVDWNCLTKQYFSDTVYSDQIRPMIQPSTPAIYRREGFDSTVLPNKSEPSQSSDIVPPVLPKPPTVLETHLNGHTSSSPMEMFGVSTSSPVKPVNSDLNQPQELLSTLSKKTFLWDVLSTKDLNALSLRIPTSIRRLSDLSFWHSGLTMLRTLPDNLGMASNPPDPEVRQFLRELLDYFTHLGNFSPVVDPRLILAVAAEQDAYVPRDGVTPLNELYPESDIRILPQSGHVGAYVRNAVWTRDFQQAITDCLNRQVELHYGQPGPFGQPPSQPSRRKPSVQRTLGP